MEVVIFGGLALLGLWAFTRTPNADKPFEPAEPFDSTTGGGLTLVLLVVLVFLLLGLMGSAVPGSAYDKVEQAGDADMLAAFTLSAIIGVIGGLMVVNGVARGLGTVLMLAGIFLTVAITATAGALP